MAYVTISRSRVKRAQNYSFAKKVAESKGGRLFRRGRKSIAKVVAEATRAGEDTVVIVSKKGKRNATRELAIRNGAYRWKAR